MAQASGLLGSWNAPDGGRCELTISYNDQNNNVASASLTNFAARTFELTLWDTTDPANSGSFPVNTIVRTVGPATEAGPTVLTEALPSNKYKYKPNQEGIGNVGSQGRWL